MYLDHFVIKLVQKHGIRFRKLFHKLEKIFLTVKSYLFELHTLKAQCFIHASDKNNGSSKVINLWKGGHPRQLMAF